MLKLQSLRRVIEQAVPDLVRDPERLIVIAGKGRAVATGTDSLSFEYRYTAYVTVLDYTGHMDALILPVLAWAKRHQSELFENPARRDDALRFNVDYLNTEAVDVGLEIELTERAIVTADAAHPTRVHVEHPPEPCHIGRPCLPELWELWLRDQLLAQWRIEPPASSDRFRVGRG